MCVFFKHCTVVFKFSELTLVGALWAVSPPLFCPGWASWSWMRLFPSSRILPSFQWPCMLSVPSDAGHSLPLPSLQQQQRQQFPPLHLQLSAKKDNQNIKCNEENTVFTCQTHTDTHTTHSRVSWFTLILW